MSQASSTTSLVSHKETISLRLIFYVATLISSLFSAILTLTGKIIGIKPMQTESDVAVFSVILALAATGGIYSIIMLTRQLWRWERKE